MSRTPGVVLPSSFSSEEELLKDLQRRGSEAGFTLIEDDDPFVAQADAAVDFLSHYGVKGMKWGVSRSQLRGALGQATAKPGKPSAEAKALAKTNAKAKSQKSVKSLSNKELKDALERMRLEKQYSEMTGGIDKTTQQKAAGFVGSLVSRSAKEVAGNVVGAQVKGAMNSATTRKPKEEES